MRHAVAAWAPQIEAGIICKLHHYLQLLVRTQKSFLLVLAAFTYTEVPHNDETTSGTELNVKSKEISFSQSTETMDINTHHEKLTDGYIYTWWEVHSSARTP